MYAMTIPAPAHASSWKQVGWEGNSSDLVITTSYVTLTSITFATTTGCAVFMVNGDFIGSGAANASPYWLQESFYLFSGATGLSGGGYWTIWDWNPTATYVTLPTIHVGFTTGPICGLGTASATYDLKWSAYGTNDADDESYIPAGSDVLWTVAAVTDI
jgi:hypothetical protein